MPDDYDPEQAALDDAIIEDTVHCKCCGAYLCLGGSDCLIAEQEVQGGVVQLILCDGCSEMVYKNHIAACAEADICPHGLCLSQPCDECLEAWKVCADVVKFFGSHEAWGDYATLGKAAVAFAPIAERARAVIEGRAR